MFLVGSSPQRVRPLSPSHAVCYPLRAICGRGIGLLRISGPVQQSRVTGYRSGRFLKERPSLVLRVVRFPSSKHFLETSPLRNGRRFWRSVARQNQACRHRGFLLHTVARLLGPRLVHYYGIICHLTSRRLLLELPLEAALPASHASPLGGLTRPG